MQNAFVLVCFLLLTKHVFSIEAGTNSSPTSLPVETTFTFPSPLPIITPGESNFGKGKIDLGGLEVIQTCISTTTTQRVWRTYEGGLDNVGVTILKPINLPQGFSTLGFYAQPNNRNLFGWFLVARDISGTTLRPPVDYILIGDTTTIVVKQEGPAYFWQPTCPNGYLSVGLIVTNSPQKPPLEDISCVRSDLTEPSETDILVLDIKEIIISSLRPVNRGIDATGVYTGTFTFQQLNFTTQTSLLSLKNTKFDLSSMPSQDQVRDLFKSYSPWIYLHPKEEFLPSSVDYIFSNGALLYQKGNESNPIPIQPNGTNLPQGGLDDGMFWLDYPSEKKEMLKRGDLGNTKVYLHIKPMFGGTFTDIVVWIFYPFNGNARLKIFFIKSAGRSWWSYWTQGQIFLDR